MMRGTACLWTILGLFMFSACAPDVGEIFGTVIPEVTLSANPTNPASNQVVTFTLTATGNDFGNIVLVRIDFERDGIWDVTRSISPGRPSITEMFSHSYPSAGPRRVIAEVVFASQSDWGAETAVLVS